MLHAPAAQITDRFRARLIDPVFDEGADAPDLILVDYQFGNGATDLEIIDEFAQHGASLPAVVLAGISPAFFGVKQAWQVQTLPAAIAYRELATISYEAREKLSAARPATIGQAGRIPGVSPSDLQNLVLAVLRLHGKSAVSRETES